MERKIRLKFSNSLSRLAGNSFGNQIFNDQVKDRIDYSTKYTIEFPNEIEDVAISFVQGFISQIVKDVGIERLFDVIEINASTKVKDKFYKSVFF